MLLRVKDKVGVVWGSHILEPVQSSSVHRTGVDINLPTKSPYEAGQHTHSKRHFEQPQD